MLGRALRREAQHGHARILEACHRLGGLSRADGNLCQLVGIGHGRHSHVAYDHHAVLAILRLLRDEQHGTAHAGDARGALDDLQRRTQRVARGRERTRNLTVGTLGLDDHATQVERVLHQFAGLLDGHALLLAQLSQQLGILLAAGVVQRVDDGGLVDVGESILLGIGLDALRITNEDDVGQFVGQHAVGGAQGALLFGLGQHDALLVSLCTCHDLL